MNDRGFNRTPAIIGEVQFDIGQQIPVKENLPDGIKTRLQAFSELIFSRKARGTDLIEACQLQSGVNGVAILDIPFGFDGPLMDLYPGIFFSFCIQVSAKIKGICC